MKKILAMMLTAAMMLSMGTAVFADEAADPNTYTAVPKTYEVKSGTAPAETFTYTFKAISYEDGDGKVYTADDNGVCTEINYTIPAIDSIDHPFDETDETVHDFTKNVEIDMTQTAGITYSTEKLYLVLTILREEDSDKYYVAHIHYMSADNLDGKDDKGFTNIYESGSLEITKKITGNMADMTKKFTFTVVFEAVDGEVLKSTIATNADTSGIVYNQDSQNKYKYTFEIGVNDTALFTNLPDGIKYTVSEDAENYKQTEVTGETKDTTEENNTVVTGTIVEEEKDEVSYTNTLTNEVDTGISVDSIPYIAMLGVVAIGGTGFIVSKKRRSED